MVLKTLLETFQHHHGGSCDGDERTSAGSLAARLGNLDRVRSAFKGDMTRVNSYLQGLGKLIEQHPHNHRHKKMHIHHQPYIKHSHEFASAARSMQANGQSLDELAALKEHFDKNKQCNFTQCPIKRKANGEVCHMCKCSRYN